MADEIKNIPTELPADPREGLRYREVPAEDESLVQKVTRNATPENDLSRKALGPEHQFDTSESPQAAGEEQYKENFGSPLEQAYGKMKHFLGEHEKHLSEQVLTPFRQGLDRMGEDLKQAGETGHTQSGGPLNPVTRALATGTGELMQQVPVGRNVSETAQAMITPPELGPEKNALTEAANTVKQLGQQAEASFPSMSAQQKVEHIGMKHGGEVVPGTGVHLVEHPDLPGKTFTIKESQMTSPEEMKNIANTRLGELKSAPTTDELNARLKTANKTAGKSEKIQSQQIKEGPAKEAWTRQNVDYELDRLRGVTRNPKATEEEKQIAQHQLDTLKEIEQRIITKGSAGLSKNIKFGDDNKSRIVVGLEKPKNRLGDRPLQKNWPPKVSDPNSYDKNVLDPYDKNYSNRAGAREPIKTA